MGYFDPLSVSGAPYPLNNGKYCFDGDLINAKVTFELNSLYRWVRFTPEPVKN